MKKFVLENFKYAMLPKSATRLVAGGATCQVISCAAGVTCKVYDSGKTECCGERKSNDENCRKSSVAMPGPIGDDSSPGSI